VSRASTRRWQERARQQQVNATAAARANGARIAPSGSEAAPTGTGPTDGPDALQGNVEAQDLLRARAREADPYVHAETVVAHDGTEIRIWAPRSAVEALYPAEKGRR
jgi:hypothetical protein